MTSPTSGSFTLIRICVFIGLCKMVYSELYTSTADIESMLKAEQGSASILNEYIKTEYSRLLALKEYMSDHTVHCEQLRLNQSKSAEPLNLFLFIKRLHWIQILMKKNNAEDYLQRITHHRHKSRGGLPTDDDVIGSALALFRLQDTYKLEAKDLADGLYGGVKLTAFECYELGKMAYDLDESDYYHSLLWMNEADRRLSSEKLSPSMKREDILDYLSYVMYEQGNIERAWILSKQLRSLNSSRHLVNENIDFYEELLIQNGVDVHALSEFNLPNLKLHRDLSHKPPWFEQYERLCRGERSLSKKLKSQLKCYYKRNRPYLRLAAMKAEVVHLKPKMVLFKNVVSDSECTVIQDIAGPKFERAGVVRASGNFEASDKRTSKIAWIRDVDSDVVNRISKRVEDMTDLTCKTAEYLQVSNYGIGGHYEAHLDFTPDDATPGEAKTFEEWKAGNRIATILFYLSQPQAGGATVFPDLNLTLDPSKNDAVFWYNLRVNGKGDNNLRHAACPVLAGTKWVANKWLHEYGQDFIRPCSLNIDEYE